MTEKASEHRIVMAKAVASRWLESRLRPEYRLRVYYGAKEVRGVPALLRSFRDARLKIGSVDPIQDLGVREDIDHFEVWSADRDGLRELQAWFEVRGCETTGVW